MNKYDTTLDLESHNSLSVLLKWIEKESKILEFGPAMGRMTKYLKQNLSCDVSIIEIDEEAFKVASRYAINGYCGDIEEYKWFDMFCDIKYDYIIFADVLEHLKNPGEVLNKVKKLLSEKGRILISLPNIAHNSVVYDLIRNRFDYKDVGLLDITHLKFFTIDSAIEMVESAGLNIRSTDLVKVPFQYFDNYNDYLSEQNSIKEVLDNRLYQDVFQILINCSIDYGKAEYDQDLISNDIGSRKIFTKLYMDFGDGYSEENSILSYGSLIKGFTKHSFDLSKYQGIKNLRFDPCESQCTIENLKANADGESIEKTGSNSDIFFDNTEIFLNSDPMYFFNLNKSCNYKDLVIEFSLKTVDYHFATMYLKDIIIEKSFSEELKNKELILSQHSKNLKEKELNLINQSKNLDEKELRLIELEKKLSEKELRLIELEKKLSEKELCLFEYSKELNEKEDEVNRQINIIEDRKLDIQLKNYELEANKFEMENLIAELTNQLEHYIFNVESFNSSLWGKIYNKTRIKNNK